MALEDALSAERLATYRAWAQHDNHKALLLYALNVAVSEAFYTSLHTLEITLRNSIHRRLVSTHGGGWFRQQQLITNQFQRQKVAEAYAKFGGQANDGQVVAELTFGFWTALFGKRNNELWGQTLRPVFSASVKRKDIARRLSDIRRLRNRIAHHEPIIQQDLPAVHQEIMEVTGWMSVDALAWCNAHCRFNATHPGIAIIVGNLKNPRLVL